MTGAHNAKILYVMAADAEYGARLRDRITPLMLGVGPVEAAVNMTRALASRDRALPDFVVSLGSAGSDSLNQGVVYQATSVTYRDMDASAIGFEKGRTPFVDLPAAINLPYRLDDYPEASLSTGGAIVNGEGYRSLGAEMADMETYAILRACQAFDVPLLALRGISDGREQLTQYADWLRYLDVIDAELAVAVDAIEAALADGRLRRVV